VPLFLSSGSLLLYVILFGIYKMKIIKKVLKILFKNRCKKCKKNNLWYIVKTNKNYCAECDEEEIFKIINNYL